jgi:DNA-binding transcriptional LysR family regulator
MDKFAELRAFVEVVDTGDLSSAARRLGVTPSGVSRTISRLEQRLGSTLMRRLSKGITLTAEGSRFLEGARHALAALHDAESAAAQTVKGTLRVGCLPSFAIWQLAPLVPDLRRRYPELRIEFVLSSDVGTLLDRQMDVSIASGALPDSSLVARRFATSRWISCASPEYLRQHGRPNSIAELAKHSTLNFVQRTPWNDWLELPEVSGRSESHQYLGANQGDMLLALGRSGAGIVRLAEYHVSADLRAGHMEEVLGGLIADDEEVLYLVYEKHKHTSARILAFLEFVAEHFQEGAEPWRNNSPIDARHE